MNDPDRAAMLQAYADALESFLSGGGERVLEDAYSLGRQLIADGGGIVELGEIHRRALKDVLPQAVRSRGCVAAAALATRFLAEASSSFEMVLRGYRDTTAALKELNATLEARVADRTRDLAEAEARNLQAQKEETIGRLAGGIAHDFNNLLSVILTCSDMAIASIDAESEVREDLVVARKAAMSASDLTRKLLAFSRNQMLEPRVVDLNEIVRDLERMLRRLIRSDIELGSRLAPGLASVKVDPIQLEQVIVNLVVNARDAVVGRGTITLSTDNIAAPEARTAERTALGQASEGAPDGTSFVRLSISDTGEGMEEDVLSRAFEPFFTTKEEGRGTGLGLPTCQGVVKQTGGFVHIDSQPGAGTRVDVFLPATHEKPSEARDRPASEEDRSEGDRTVLLVDDNEGLRRIVRRVLESRGYKVHDAMASAGAIEVLSQQGEDIDLLLSDVMLPGGMRGPELLSVAQSRWPHLRVLATTAYADDDIRAALEGVRVVQKPFSSKELLDAVVEALGASA